MRWSFLLLAVAGGAFAQDAEMQRAVMERDQRTLEFAARLNGAPPAVLQALDNLFARQQLQVLTNTLPPPRPDQRQLAAREAEGYVLQLPPPVARSQAIEDLRRLIEAPRCAPLRPPGDAGEVCR
ncbi:MAG TPA: hypothetical protein VFV84_05230 [Burkholderiales bacterium]|nr:hypothetical protein [Burkholderiales bacterium]